MKHALTRWARHLWVDADDARRTLTDEGLRRLAECVQASEARHLGELRLCVEGGLPITELWRGTDSRERAIELFSELQVWDTEHNNGVLIYLLLADHRIEILADRGLHKLVPHDTWETIAQSLSSALHAGQFEAGLTQAIHEVGVLLRQHFPSCDAHPNPNELPDAVVLR